MRKIGLNKQLLVWNAILLALVGLSFALMLAAIQDLRNSDRFAMDEKRLILTEQVQRRLVEVQNGHRGFAIAGDPELLAPRQRAVRALPGLERNLLALEEDTGDAAHLEQLRRLFSDVGSYVRNYSARVVAAARRDPAQAREIIGGGGGTRRMAGLLRGFAAYSADLTAEAAAARSAARDSADRAILLGVICMVGVILVVCGVAVIVARGIVRPLTHFARAARRISEGDLSVRVSERGPGEVRRLAGALNSMAGSLEGSRDELLAQHARERRHHDFVVRLSGSRGLGTLAETTLADLRRFANADRAAFFLIDARAESEDLWLVTTSGFDGDDPPSAIRAGEGLLGRAVAECRPLVDCDERAELALPIVHGNRVLGGVLLARAIQSPFGGATVEELETLMYPVASALGTALALRAAKNAAELNRAVLDSTHDAYVATGERGTIQAWSPQATSLFGYGEEEAMGRRLDELLLPPEARAEHKRHLSRVLARADDDEPLERLELWAQRKDGHRMLTEISIAAVHMRPNPLVTYFARDVTEERSREAVRRADEEVSRVLAEAERSEEVIAPILAAIGESLGWAYGAVWEYDEHSGQLRCLYGWNGDGDGDGGLDKTILDAAIDPEHPPAELAPVAEAWASRETRWQTMRGQPVLSERRAGILARGVRARLMLPVRSSRGKPAVLEFGARSEEPPADEILESLRSTTDLVGQVVERRHAYEEAERLKSEFFALVSHELRTPLTSVMGYVEIIRDGEAGSVNNEQRRYLEVIRRNTERLLRLVGDLLFIAQVEAGTLSFERQAVELDSIVSEAIDAARPAADKKDIHLSAEIEPLAIEGGDAGRLGQMVDNLVSNALKFTPIGGSVTVRLRRRDEGGALIEVADTGIGIPAEDREHLFERFFRSGEATRKAIPGVGLGLSICRAIAEGHGGSISVESEEGRGTTFSVDLPSR